MSRNGGKLVISLLPNIFLSVGRKAFPRELKELKGGGAIRSLCLSVKVLRGITSSYLRPALYKAEICATL